MTGDQCRKARERLNWARHELATATDVPLWFIAAFEDGNATPGFLAVYEVDLRAALEAGTARGETAAMGSLFHDGHARQGVGPHAHQAARDISRSDGVCMLSSAKSTMSLAALIFGSKAFISASSKGSEVDALQ